MVQSEIGQQPLSEQTSTNVSTLVDKKIRGKVMYVFSGPKRDADGLRKYCMDNDLECDYFDKSMMHSKTSVINRSGME